MAIKALKQNISISEMQKITHQWKAKGVTDSATLKLLDLYLGMPNFMNQEGIYPISNLYQLSLALKTTHTADVLTAIKKSDSFGLIWDKGHEKLLGFFSPLWHTETGCPVTGPVNPAANPAVNQAANQETDSMLNNNIYNNIYPPEDSRKGKSSGNKEGNPAETDHENATDTPSEVPDGNPDGTSSPAVSPAQEFFHRLNINPQEKQQILVPIIDSIADRENYTRPRALDALVILVNEILVPHFDSAPRFAKTTHAGRIIWLQNLMKTAHGRSLLDKAAGLLGKKIERDMEERRKKQRDYRPVSPFEWKDPDKDIRYYDDPIDGKVEIPADASPRPDDTAIWNVLSKQWVAGNG